MTPSGAALAMCGPRWALDADSDRSFATVGLMTRLHLVCDGRDRPLGKKVTGGNINDTTMLRNQAWLRERHLLLPARGWAVLAED
ncbi:hypothetical protein AHIS1636_28550 [Arthrobacter mangrovi]|uniref:Transposase n=1 Tax=Arthrobacter mangrovi TaxID=2966350 RepID=A0ABQ5MWW1_9MICC|nr:hypothetical protein AHIS1636_28550 [Arthrobacter mangrovi]